MSWNWMAMGCALGCLALAAPAGAEPFSEGFDSYPGCEPGSIDPRDLDPGGSWRQIREPEPHCGRIERSPGVPPWVQAVPDPDHVLALHPVQRERSGRIEFETLLGLHNEEKNQPPPLWVEADVRPGYDSALNGQLRVSTGRSFWNQRIATGMSFRDLDNGHWAEALDAMYGSVHYRLLPLVAGQWIRTRIEIDAASDRIALAAGKDSSAVERLCIVDRDLDFTGIDAQTGGMHPLELIPNAAQPEQAFPVASASGDRVCISDELGVDLTACAAAGDVYLLRRGGFPSWQHLDSPDQPNHPKALTFGPEQPIYLHAWLAGMTNNGQLMIDRISANAVPERYRLPFAGPANLVPNPGFEAERDGRPLVWTEPAVHDTGRAHGGSAALRLDAGGALAPQVTATTHTRMPINHFFAFELAGWIYLDNAACRPILAAEYEEKPLLEYGSFQGEYQSVGVREIDLDPLPAGEWVAVAGRPGGGVAPLDVQPLYARVVLGLECPDGEAGSVWFDDLEFDGLGSDSPRLAVPDVGFHAQGLKEVTVASRTPVAGGRWELYSAGGASLIASGGLAARPGTGPWGRHQLRADLTGVEALGQPGGYRLELVLDDGQQASWTFQVHDRLYERLARLERYYFGGSRCGTATDFHPACHLWDADLDEREFPDGSTGPVTEPLHGGWHDSGGYGKYVHLYGPAVAGLTGLAELLAGEEAELPAPDDPRPDPPPPWLQALFEADWGVEYFHRVVRENELVPEPCGLRNLYWGEVEDEPKFWVRPDDPNPPNSLERVVHAFDTGDGSSDPPNIGDVRAMPLHAWGLARYARLLDALGGWPERADAALAEAWHQYDCYKTVVRNLTAFYNGVVPWLLRPEYRLGTVPRQLLAAIALWDALPGNDPARGRLAEDIDRDLATVMADLQLGWDQAAAGVYEYGFFRDDYQMDSWYGISSIAKIWPLAVVDALGAALDLVLEPDDPRRAAVLGHLERIGAAMVANMDRSVWGHASEIAPEQGPGEHRQFPRVDRNGHYTTTYGLAAAAALAQIARRTRRPDFLAAAERSLQWFLGRNPMRLTYVGGLPGRMANSRTYLSAIDYEGEPWPHSIPQQVAGIVLQGPFRSNGVLPGGIVKGVHPGVGVIAGLSDQRAAPMDFPVTYGRTDYPFDGSDGPSEMWSFFVLQALRAGVELERAFAALGPLEPHGGNGFEGQQPPDGGVDDGGADDGGEDRKSVV